LKRRACAAADRHGRAVLRKIIEDRFKTLWWVPENATADVGRYMRSTAPAAMTRIYRNTCRLKLAVPPSRKLPRMDYKFGR
jgi:hypothetical protein